jgi:hypothetical protein
VDTLAGTDDASHIYIIQVETPIQSGDTSETWSLTTLSNYILRFLPPDAKSLGTEAQGGGKGETMHDLYSARLAATFSADKLTNDGGARQVQPGTLNWSCLLARFPGGPSTGVNTCTIAIGTYN